MAYLPRTASLDNKYIDVSQPTKFGTVLNKTSDHTITADELSWYWGKGAGLFCSNQGASGNVKFILPENPTAGYEAMFMNTEGTHQLNVVTTGSDIIYQGGAQNVQALYTTTQGGILWGQYAGDNIWYFRNFGPATRVT